MQNPIRFFSSISASDINEVGGKGANLGELTAAGFNVPDGFCITTKAYYAFILPKKKQLELLLENLDATDLKALQYTGNKVRQMLTSLPLPDQLHKPLIKAWQKLGEDNAYAVRSSATAEDLPQASFAGQQDTYLNIVGQRELLNSVKNCFISLFTDRAILYRVQNQFDHRDVGLSVVVQKMIIPQASGIMFTADPVNGNRNIVSIDAGFGIGEALVSGLVSADLYQVDKTKNLIIKRQIGDKKIAIVPGRKSGTKTVELSSEESAKSTLDDKQIMELATLGVNIEKHYQKPQDIEWVLADDQFHITQSRPITSLYPLPGESEEPGKLYASFNHFQVMTDAMPPLSISLFRTIIPVGRDETTLQSRYVVPVGGRIYGEISNILNHPIAGKLFPKIVGRADHLVGKMVTNWQRSNPKPKQKSKIRMSKLLPIVLPLLTQVKSCLWWKKYDEFPLQMSQLMDRHVDQTRDRIAQAASVDAQLDICVEELRGFIHTIAPWRAKLLTSLLALKLLDVAMKNRVDSSELDALMRGLEGNVTTQMDLAVGDLADRARASSQLRECIVDRDTDYASTLKRAEKLPSGSEFIAEWNTFIEKYGARGPSEIDLIRPRWREDASSLMTMVAGMLKSGKAGAHRMHYQTLILENQQASDSIIEAAGQGISGFVRKPVVRRLTYVIRELFPLREHHKFLLIRLFDLSKPVIERAGHQLHSQSLIEDTGDVWFLTLPELQAWLGQKTAIEKSEISRRKQDFEHYRQMTPPRVITGEGEILSASYDTSHAPDGALVGSPVSAGTVEGIAKVILDPSTQTLHPGEILIAPFTDPGWTPLFVNAGGLVTEVGGLMTHGSVIAREYGIPAVVGVIDATKTIRTGQLIRVHGEAGYVEILDDNEEQVS